MAVRLGRVIPNPSNAVGSAVFTGIPRKLTPANTERPPRAAAVPTLPAKSDRSVAVVPLVNRGPPEDDTFAEGVREELVDELTEVHHLRVRPLGAARKVSDGKLDPRDIGLALGVDAIIEGSVRRQGTSLRLSLRVVGVADGFQLWAKRFELPVAEALSATAQVVHAVAEALSTRTDTPQPLASALTPVVTRYLQAKALIRRGYPPDVARAMQLLLEARAQAPSDPKVLTAIAACHLRRLGSGMGDAATDVPAAARAIADAQSLGHESAELWAAIGEMRWHCDDLPGAVRALGNAVRLAPGLASAQEKLAGIALEVDRKQEAASRFAAVLAIDPAAPLEARYGPMVARALLGDSAGAVAAISVNDPDAMTAMGVRFAMMRLQMWGLVPLDSPQPVVGIESMDPAFAALVKSFFDVMDRILGQRVLSAADRATLLSMGGGQQTQRMKAASSQFMTEALMFVSDPEGAFQSLELAVQDGLADLAWLMHCPLLAPLRSRPGWHALVEVLQARAAAASQALDANGALPEPRVASDAPP